MVQAFRHSKTVSTASTHVFSVKGLTVGRTEESRILRSSGTLGTLQVGTTLGHGRKTVATLQLLVALSVMQTCGSD